MCPVPNPIHNSFMKKWNCLDQLPEQNQYCLIQPATKLYAMNLEGMSVYEFDQATRKITREFKFKPTQRNGLGLCQGKTHPFLPGKTGRGLLQQ